MSDESMTLDDKITMLRDAGFDLAWADRDDIWPQGGVSGHIRSTDLTWEDGPMSSWQPRVCADPDAYEDRVAYVSFGDVAAGEDRFGQTSTVDRSNYRSIKRDFTDVPWVDVSYSNRDDLGAFVADLSADMIEMLCGLKVEYPVYDEGDMSALESEEQEESWDDWLRRTIRDHLSEPARDVYDYVWDHLSVDDLDGVWWDLVREDGLGGCLPDHDGLDVLWGDLDRAGAAYSDALISFGATLGDWRSLVPGPLAIEGN